MPTPTWRSMAAVHGNGVGVGALQHRNNPLAIELDYGMSEEAFELGGAMCSTASSPAQSYCAQSASSAEMF
uniref:Uncharacterized protein n=1 Tax=Oryza sativa subsp. japonica TaxID=39947 RepID=Q84Z47_ORYSJ|nr:hypothetical protein [Oryza sativa Japonica Group]BAD31689.1 hypothetical protein [Oryza sativa Japonica Group]